ncbi:hypothetical protein Abiwalacus_17440 [Akkermansia biwaensis]|jgi:hypothetical protein|uniref:Uncharacterized protein n=1 Tax=Akkermansia biwaensis TaxID=2946555 RepID=A0ABN6QI25_9BACT|nr:hypothetical protein Abiwalacus_17440 [Akkermansia biwaensis]
MELITIGQFMQKANTMKGIKNVLNLIKMGVARKQSNKSLKNQVGVEKGCPILTWTPKGLKSGTNKL